MGTSARSVISLLSKPRIELQDHAAHHFRLLNKRQSARLSKRNEENNYSMSVAESPAGQIKNRYSNIIPFNRNRIRLKRSDLIGEEYLDPAQGDDYINASLIQPPLNIQNKQYIATQGPLKSTVGDFWRMVIEQNTKVIVCLSPELENDQEKCARYWPIESECKEIPLGTNRTNDQHRHQTLRGLFQLRNPTTSNSHASHNTTSSSTVTMNEQKKRNIVVRLRNIEPERVDQDADCIIRRIQVSFVDITNAKDNNVVASGTVTQIQFLGWADFSVPEHTEPVLALSRLADQYQAEGAGPIVVHCSAGCGRTGTFCVVNSGMAWLCSALNGTGDVVEELPSDDLVYILADTFRKQRTTMVQASSQFFFCYRALYDGYKQEFEQ